jgi:hypothetical protein
MASFRFRNSSVSLLATRLMDANCRPLQGRIFALPPSKEFSAKSRHGNKKNWTPESLLFSLLFWDSWGVPTREIGTLTYSWSIYTKRTTGAPSYGSPYVVLPPSLASTRNNLMAGGWDKTNNIASALIKKKRRLHWTRCWKWYFFGHSHTPTHTYRQTGHVNEI